MFYTFKYRIYPNNEQQNYFEQCFGAVRFVYNWGLNLRIETYQQTKKSVSFFDTGKALTKLKQQNNYTWLNNINAQTLEASLKHLDIAYTAFFKKNARFPKFKSKKKSKTSFSLRQGTKIKNNKLFICKLQTGINIVLSRPIIGKIKNSTITKTKSGKYFIAIQTETTNKAPQAPLPDINTAVGVDLGIKTFAILSNGIKIDNPKYLNKYQKQLIKLQRQFEKKQKGSNKKEKLRIKIAKLYEKITFQRLDFLHKITTQLANDNQVGTYCLEDLNVARMLKNHKLARSISDASWSKFVELLKYKCERAGKNILFIGRFEPSSKMCLCGKINKTLTLKDRVWTCQSCGLSHDRDILAANNIKAFAFNHQNLMSIVGPDRPELTPVKSEKFSLVEAGN